MPLKDVSTMSPMSWKGFSSLKRSLKTTSSGCKYEQIWCVSFRKEFVAHVNIILKYQVILDNANKLDKCSQTLQPVVNVLPWELTVPDVISLISNLMSKFLWLG